MNALHLKGLIAATFTPMDQDGQVRLEAIPTIVESLVNQGVAGVFVNGTTGEGIVLNAFERRQLAETYSDAAQGRLPVIVHIGHSCLHTAAELAAHAEGIGADAIAFTPTGFFPHGDEANIVKSLRPVAAAAARTPFYYYHIPGMSGVKADPVRLASIAAQEWESFVGIKYSDGSTLYNLPLIQEAVPGIEVMAGSDEYYLGSLALGYDSAVGSTYNFAAPLYNRVREAFEAGRLNEAALWQGRAVTMIRLLFENCGFAGLKAMMRITGHDCGPVRPPVSPASDASIANLQRAIFDAGWESWIADAQSEVIPTS